MLLFKCLVIIALVDHLLYSTIPALDIIVLYHFLHKYTYLHLYNFVYLHTYIIYICTFTWFIYLLLI